MLKSETEHPWNKMLFVDYCLCTCTLRTIIILLILSRMQYYISTPCILTYINPSYSSVPSYSCTLSTLIYTSFRPTVGPSPHTHPHRSKNYSRQLYKASSTVLAAVRRAHSVRAAAPRAAVLGDTGVEPVVVATVGPELPEVVLTWDRRGHEQ